jgi:hypothetical protein
VPVLRKEFATNRPADVPDGPTHAALVARKVADEDAARALPKTKENSSDLVAEVTK